MDERNLKIFIADGDAFFADSVRKSLIDSVSCDVFVVNDFSCFIDTVRREQPDVIIMDVVLPGVDGLSFIKNCSVLSGGKDCEIIVVSSFYNDRYIKESSVAGVFGYFVKPILPESVTDIVKSASKRFMSGGSSRNYMSFGKSNFSVIEEPVMMPSAASGFDVDKSYGQRRLIVKITQLLHDMGIPAHLCGHDYLREAILMVMESHEVSGRMTKEIYPEIANKYKKSPQSVERAIRTALDVAWTRGKTELINDIFRFTVNIQKGRPTNSEFVSLIADYLNYDCMNLA
ncbi:MAG: response regulator [Ruminococcaceae bacterium]|nr:response regulator [Oscillospiraceae bacterium]